MFRAYGTAPAETPSGADIYPWTTFFNKGASHYSLFPPSFFLIFFLFSFFSLFSLSIGFFAFIYLVLYLVLRSIDLSTIFNSGTVLRLIVCSCVVITDCIVIRCTQISLQSERKRDRERFTKRRACACEHVRPRDTSHLRFFHS